VHEAELVLMGPTATLYVPPNAVDHEVTGSCTIGGSQSIHAFSIAPHAHQTASHLKTEFEIGGVVTTPYDLPYSFDEQVGQLLPQEVELQPGDKVTTTCTYTNPTGQPITFGESSDSEMCFSAVYYWPAQNHVPYCADDYGGW
jgi:hypothetical protein